MRALAQGKRDGARRRQVPASAGTQETVGGSGVERSGTESPVASCPLGPRQPFAYCSRKVLYLSQTDFLVKTMKRPFLCFVTLVSLALLGSMKAHAQVVVADTTSHKEVSADFFLPEDDVWHPTFMGQDKNAFSQWVKEHQRYPKKAKKAGIQGRVVVRFTIDEKGRMTDVQLVRGVHPLLDKEALRVIKSAPKKWTAGTRNGKPFAFKYTLTVGFFLYGPLFLRGKL